jgi:hypothetical protein
MKEEGKMKLRHHSLFFNDLPLLASTRVRELKVRNPAADKLLRKFGLSDPLARTVADLNGFEPRRR